MQSISSSSQHTCLLQVSSDGLQALLKRQTPQFTHVHAGCRTRPHSLGVKAPHFHSAAVWQHKQIQIGSQKFQVSSEFLHYTSQASCSNLRILAGINAAPQSIAASACALALSCLCTGGAHAAEPAEVFQRSGCVGERQLTWLHSVTAVLLMGVYDCSDTAIYHDGI